MRDRAWFNYLSDLIRIRTRAGFDHRGGIESFTLQLEYALAEEWLPVIRFDSAHGDAHIDYLDPNAEE